MLLPVRNDRRRYRQQTVHINLEPDHDRLLSCRRRWHPVVCVLAKLVVFTGGLALTLHDPDLDHGLIVPHRVVGLFVLARNRRVTLDQQTDLVML